MMLAFWHGQRHYDEPGQDEPNLTAGYYRYVGRAITPPRSELVIQIRSQVLLFRPCLPHGICVSSSRSLTSLSHVRNLGIALEVSDVTDNVLQR